jgi:hypothetical protein
LSRGKNRLTFPTLTAVGTERIIDPNALDVPLVLICYAQATQAAGASIETALRARYADASALTVAHLVDLHSVPRMLRGVAEGILRNEYKQAVAGLAEGQMPYDYTIVLPDWDGSTVASFGLVDVDAHAGVAVFAPPGRLVGIDQGDDPASDALSMLEGLV